MRKVVLGFLGLCLSMVLMSCSSLPKVSAGKNIVAGKVITTGVNFDGVYTPFNGKHTDENIVFVEAFLSKNNDPISINRIEIDKKSVTAKQMVHDIW